MASPGFSLPPFLFFSHLVPLSIFGGSIAVPPHISGVSSLAVFQRTFFLLFSFVQVPPGMHFFMQHVFRFTPDFPISFVV